MKKILLALSILSIIAVAGIVAECSDDSYAAICDDVNVYIQNGDGTYTKSTVDNVQTVLEAVNKAIADQNRSMQLNSTRTSIVSVDGRTANSADGMYWRVFQWLAPGNSGWSLQGFNQKSNDNMMSGTSYCVTVTKINKESGSIVYDPPNFKPVSTGYIFIRFANGFAPDNEHVKKVFTPEIREQGFWLSAEGSSMGEVLRNAIEANWPGEIKTYTGNDGMGNDVADWIDVMFGLGNDNLGDNTWAFWNQFCWMDHQWSFNSYTLGYYDPAVYPYVECIYLISTPDPYSDGYVQDKGGPEPNPDTDEIVCMKNIIDVRFRLQDGTVWKTQQVKYGEQVDMSKVEEPSVAGKGFVGWGDTTVPITKDTVFTASFVSITPEMKCVTYLSENNQLIRKEYVTPGFPATYAGIPTKPSTQQYDYAFSNWDADLSSVVDDISVKPVFTQTVRSYDVKFFNYDRSPVSVSSTDYGSAAILPAEPSRESTVRYQYSFVGWSITPNNYVPVNLSNITDTTYAYAYFQPEARQYTLTIKENGVTVGTYPVKYGSSIGGTVPMDVFHGSALAKMYRDPELTKEYGTNHIVVGDTTVHISRIAGAYDAPRDADGNMSGDTVFVSFTDALASNPSIYGGRVVLCDLSQYPNATEVSIDKTSLSKLMSAHGGDTEAIVIVPRGSFSMALSSLFTVMGDGDELTFSVLNGPFNVKISSVLKKINYSNFYRLDLRVDGASVMDLKSLGVDAEVSLLTELEEGVRADVWNITSTGATTHIDPSYDGRFATFRTDLMQFYAVGTTEKAAVRQIVVCPYGDVEYLTEGAGINGSATLESMTLDNMGSVLFVPSSFGGCTLEVIDSGAFNGVVNAPAVVIPVTVGHFSWLAWSNSGIKDVYFLGDSPSFEGTVPVGVTVHHRPDATGWVIGDNDLKIHEYDGSYRKDTFRFTFYVINEEAIIHRYVFGPYVQIPDSVSVDGSSYPITQIGDAAFMLSHDSAVKTKYQLVFGDPYRITTLELNSHIKGIQTRAMYGSTFTNLLMADSVVYVYDQAFAGCGSLSNVSFSDELVFIGSGAFTGCDGKAFTRFAIPDSVRALGAGAFYGCASLSNVTFGKGLTEIPEDCFGNCPRLTDLSLTENILSIGDKAFYNCNGLQFVDLNGVQTVGKDAFYSASGSSSMEFIVLGENLKSLGSGAFGNCKKVTELEVHCGYFDSFENAFTNVDVDSFRIYASDSVLASWAHYGAQPIVEPDPQKDNGILHIVEFSLVALFVLLFGFTFYRKMKVKP